MLPLSTENLEQTTDFGLRIRRVGLRDLGPYTCQAYNGLGSPESSTFTLTVLGPIDRSSIAREDQSFLRYVVDAPVNTYYRPNPGPYRPQNPEISDNR